MRLSINSHNGELAAVLGSIAGAIVFAILGIFAARFYNYLLGIHGLFHLVPHLIGICLACWVGEIVGCWLGLRWTGKGNAGLTANFLALLTPYAVFLFFCLSWWLASVGIIDNLIGLKSLLLGALFFIALPWLARSWVKIIV